MPIELTTENIWWVTYLLSNLYVILHSFLANKETHIASRILWILVTLVFGIFGAIGYYFFGSNEYYKLSKVK